MSSIQTDNLRTRDGSSAIPMLTAIQGTDKAWFNLNGTGTIAARDSYFISSFVDNGSGDYTANYSSAMPNTNYAFLLSVGDASANLVPRHITGTSTTTLSLIRTGAGYISSLTGNSTAQDAAILNATIVGDPPV